MKRKLYVYVAVIVFAIFVLLQYITMPRPLENLHALNGYEQIDRVYIRATSFPEGKELYMDLNEEQIVALQHAIESEKVIRKNKWNAVDFIDGHHFEIFIETSSEIIGFDLTGNQLQFHAKPRVSYLVKRGDVNTFILKAFKDRAREQQNE